MRHTRTTGVGRQIALFGSLTIGAFASACASSPKIMVNGIEVYEGYWTQATDELRTRASFDLNCPPAQIQFVLMKRNGRYPTEVGVTACSHRATYVRVVVYAVDYMSAHVGAWTMNVVTGPDGQPRPPDASPAP